MPIITISSVWLNAYLIHYAQSILQGINDIPNKLSLYRNNVALDPTLTLGALNVDPTFTLTVSSGWAFALTGNVEHAKQIVTFTFPDSAAGNIYYGLVLYTSDNVGAVLAPFGVEFVVPAGGYTLNVPLDLSFSSC